ncbi:MAG: hypothetical protein IJ311_06195 [Elusimicrobiaceae bacterium]|nr:hypothetical protein [Elusimicrobiaceae bacterium]
MKKIVMLLCLVVLSAPAFAGVGAFKLSLWDRAAIAIPNHIDHVRGVDLGLGSTAHSLYGVQFDILYANTKQKMIGASHALVDLAGEVRGIQGGLYARANNVKGVQWGLISITDGEMAGLQWGIYNQAEVVKGVQLGLVNYAKNIHGLQVGLVNIADNGVFPAMILLNGRF